MQECLETTNFFLSSGNFGKPLKSLVNRELFESVDFQERLKGLFPCRPTGYTLTKIWVSDAINDSPT